MVGQDQQADRGGRGGGHPVGGIVRCPSSPENASWSQALQVWGIVQRGDLLFGFYYVDGGNTYLCGLRPIPVTSMSLPCFVATGSGFSF